MSSVPVEVAVDAAVGAGDPPTGPMGGLVTRRPVP